MSLKETIEKDLIKALKSRQEGRLSILRMLKTAVHNTIIEKRAKIKDLAADLSDEEVVVVIRKMVKQIKDSLIEFEKAARLELVTKAKQEIQELEKYLPVAMAEAELEKIVKEVVAELKATKVEFGKVMGAVMKKVAGKAEGDKIKNIVNKILS